MRFGLEKGDPIELAVDNTAARDIAYKPEHHQRVKHIQRRHFFVRECVENLQITVPYVNTVDNLADFLPFGSTVDNLAEGQGFFSHA